MNTIIALLTIAVWTFVACLIGDLWMTRPDGYAPFMACCSLTAFWLLVAAVLYKLWEDAR